MVYGKQGKLEPVRHANFIENVPEMMFDGLLADRELLRDLAVRKARGDGRHNVQFAHGEAESFPGTFRVLLLRQVASKDVHEICYLFLTDPELPLHNCSNTCQKNIRRRILQNDAARTKLK